MWEYILCKWLHVIPLCLKFRIIPRALNGLWFKKRSRQSSVCKNTSKFIVSTLIFAIKNTHISHGRLTIIVQIRFIFFFYSFLFVNWRSFQWRYLTDFISQLKSKIDSVFWIVITFIFVFVRMMQFQIILELYKNYNIRKKSWNHRNLIKITSKWTATN